MTERKQLGKTVCNHGSKEPYFNRAYLVSVKIQSHTTVLFICISAGEVPDWLSGTLYRVGPGVIQSGDTLYEHLFDMPSVLHKYTLKPGVQRFTYQNRIVTLTAEDMAEGVNSQPPFGSKVRKYVFIEFLQRFREN